MATIEALQPRLRQLKLSGLVDSIAARVQEARARPLDPLDFLLLLLEDELVRRESNQSTAISIGPTSTKCAICATSTVMAEGLLDRLLNSAYMITMLGRSYRPQQRPGTSTSGASTNSGDLQVANYREQTTGNKR